MIDKDTDFTRSPIRWWGNKLRLYRQTKFTHYFPPATHYAEPFMGGLSVFLNLKYRPRHAAFNDLNGELVNFWSVVRNHQSELEAKLKYQWPGVHDEPGDDPIQRAAVFFLDNQNSGRFIGGLEYTKQFEVWAKLMDESSVSVSCMDAIKFIHQLDGASWLIYADPPYPGTDNEYGFTCDPHELYQALDDRVNSTSHPVVWVVSINEIESAPQDAHVIDLGILSKAKMADRHEYLVSNVELKKEEKSSSETRLF